MKNKKATKYAWAKNCWTGNYLAELSKTTRLTRIGSSTPCPRSGVTFLYSAEKTQGAGYSAVTMRGPWERSPTQAIKSLKEAIKAGSFLNSNA